MGRAGHEHSPRGQASLTIHGDRRPQEEAAYTIVQTDREHDTNITRGREPRVGNKIWDVYWSASKVKVAQWSGFGKGKARGPIN